MDRSGSVIAKLDFSNAFNCLQRDSMLEAVSQQIPEIYNYCHSAYIHHSVLWFDEHVIWLEEGPQQSDPLGHLLFCLKVQPLLNSLQSPLVAGFMDDFTLGGPKNVVDHDTAVMTSTGTSLGLHLNVATCQLVHPQSSAIKSAVLGSLKSTALDEAMLLRAPLLPSKRMDTALDMCCSNLYWKPESHRGPWRAGSAAITFLCTKDSAHFALYSMPRSPGPDHFQWSHDCPCRKTADARENHGLSCRLAFDKMACHHKINDLVSQALHKANIPSVKEPSGLVKVDGKRPEGSTLIPWHTGKAMAWDVTVVNTLAKSYLSLFASPGGAAEHATARKSAKYSSLPSSNIF